MRKRTVYLEPALDRAIGRLAAREGISKAEAIRRALRAATRRMDRPRIMGIGVGQGPGDVADDVDRHLAETDSGRNDRPRHLSHHLAATQAGFRALRAFRAELRAGVYLVERWPGAAEESVEVAEGFADLALLPWSLPGSSFRRGL